MVIITILEKIPRSNYSPETINYTPSMYSNNGLSSMAPKSLSGFNWNSLND